MGGEVQLLTVKVKRAWLARVRTKADQQDVTISQLVRWLLDRWLVGEIVAQPPEGGEPTRET